MKKTYLQVLFYTSLTSLLAVACSKDENIGAKPTPLSLDYPAYFGTNLNIPADNPMTVEGVNLGRHLFYDKRLSRDNTVSCASCHQQNKAFSDPNPTSKGVNGQTPMHSMGIINLAWTSDFFWNGRSRTLENQALQPIQDHIEMDMTLPEVVARLKSDEKYVALFDKAFPNQNISGQLIAKAIAQFERTLISAESKYDKYLRGEIVLSEAEERGRILFFTHPDPAFGDRGANCFHCHGGTRLAGIPGPGGFMNNGLDNDAELKDGFMEVTGNSADKGKFRSVTLRNIALTAPYMHDGRFATLEEVLDHYNTGIKTSATLHPEIILATNDPDKPAGTISLALTEAEKADIIAFLHTLTDEIFINNPQFSNPF